MVHIRFLWASALLATATASDTANNKTTVPAQLGPYKVSITTHEILTTRQDPLAPHKRKRRFMVNVFRPFSNCTTQLIPYAPPRISALLDSNNYQVDVPNGTFAKLQLESCSDPDPALQLTSAPLLIFSPGLEESSYYFSAGHAAVASAGYTVVSLEHTYESPAVLFPDGAIARENLQHNFSSPDEAYTYYGDVLTPLRTGDAVSTLDAIQAGTIPGLEAYSSTTPLRAGIYGHSLGGCTAVSALATDTRFVGGINVDGSVFGHVANITLQNPFLLINGAEVPPAAFTSFWRQLKGWKLNIRVKRSAHEAFMDFPVIADLLGTRGQPEQSPQRLGTIKGVVVQRILWAYTVAFWEYVLKGTDEGILKGDTGEYPQVVYVRMNETAA